MLARVIRREVGCSTMSRQTHEWSLAPYRMSSRTSRQFERESGGHRTIDIRGQRRPTTDSNDKESGGRCMATRGTLADRFPARAKEPVALLDWRSYLLCIP